MSINVAGEEVEEVGGGGGGVSRKVRTAEHVSPKKAYST